MIAFGFIVIMLFKTVMFKLLRPKCYANFFFQFDIALYLLIIKINIYTLFYMCFCPINYSMGKISKKNGGDPSKEVQWNSVMDDALVDALVDAFLHQVIMGGRVNRTFTSKAYDDIVKELVEKFHMEINKDKVKNRQKTLKKNFHECYDIFKDGLSAFGWNDSLNIWTTEPKVWESLIAVNYHLL